VTQLPSTTLGWRAVSVRRATPDDADAIERIRTDTWRATYRGLIPDDVLERLGYDGARRRRALAEMPRDGFALVVEHDREVVGFVYGGPSRVDVPDHPGEVYAIYVLPEHQGHGHGSALMREAARQCLERGWRGCVLWVLRENWPSRRFYERLGGRHLRDRDTDREIEGVTLTEAGYVWDDVTSLAARPARGR
jgi:ribosomal protein S18 acetylase RimI-like enzyme